jgi:HD-GYP domain-containing protein (c-di-GMP phosphodiesterase class II)
MATETLQESTADWADATAEAPSHPAALTDHPTMARFRQIARATEIDFLCVESDTGIVIGRSHADVLSILPVEVSEVLTNVTSPQTFEFASGLLMCAVSLPDVDGEKTVAVGCLLSRSETRPSEVILAAAEENWPQERVDRWFARQRTCSPEMLKLLLESTVARVDGEQREVDMLSEIQELGNQLESTYEEISLLHALTRKLQISRSPFELAELCLNRLHACIKSEGNAIWIEDKSGNPSFLVDGRIPFDEFGMARLIARVDDRDGSQPFVNNHIEGTLLGADFPGLKNVVVVPVREGSHRFGWILSCNSRGESEYGTVQASLLNSVAAILGTHLRNIDLYEQHEELMISFVRSLVSTLDAKDPYTRGHSERVALIAKRIGEKMQLPPDDMDDIYLSGLLHDIGKIGVDDRILGKPDKLSDEEFREIQRHPMIGYSILQGLKNLQRVLPGVRSHHESFNGRGYPDGLIGEEIPLMARILAVADSYDAMGSDRPYRNGLPLEKIEEIFRRGAGRQWDGRVIDAYFAIRDEVRTICAEYTPSAGNLLDAQANNSDGGAGLGTVSSRA